MWQTCTRDRRESDKCCEAGQLALELVDDALDKELPCHATQCIPPRARIAASPERDHGVKSFDVLSRRSITDRGCGLPRSIDLRPRCVDEIE